LRCDCCERLGYLLDQRFGCNWLVEVFGHLGKGEYGESLTLPTPLVPVEVFLDEPTGLFAPTTLKHFNTKVGTIRLDVSLFPLKPGVSSGGGGGGFFSGGGGGGLITGIGGSGPGGPPPGGISKYIRSKALIGEWTVEQSVGVASLAEQVLRAKSLRNLDDKLKPRLQRWCKWLRDFGIDPDVFGTDSDTDPWDFKGGGGFGKGHFIPQQPTQQQMYMGN
jgi:hypothetical protein